MESTYQIGEVVSRIVREVRAAWTDGCNCDACAMLEAHEQGFMISAWTDLELWLALRVREGCRAHGDGLWFTNSWLSGRLRRLIGWPQLKLGSGSDPSRHPTSPRR